MLVKVLGVLLKKNTKNNVYLHLDLFANKYREKIF